MSLITSEFLASFNQVIGYLPADIYAFFKFLFASQIKSLAGLRVVGASG